MLKYSRRTYAKRGIWYLGGKNKQKGGFVPILGNAARPILTTLAGAVGSKLLEGIVKKVFRGRRRRLRRQRKRIRYT